MTDTNNGWPDKPGVPMNPEKDGWHWVSLLGGDYPQIMEWFSDAMVWAEDWTVDACALHLRYLGPVLTPAEVAALQKKGCARDQTTTQYCAEVMSRDARIAELEAALEDMAKHVWRGDWDKLKPETRALLDEKK